MEKKTLGEVLRAMVDEAMNRDDKTFSVPVRKIAFLINGGVTTGDDSENIPQLKSSYIYNTTSRMQALQDAGLKVKHWYGNEGDGQVVSDFIDEAMERSLFIKLVPGDSKVGSRKVKSDEAYNKAMADIKARVLKMTPDIIDLEGDELNGALKVMKEFRDMIKEMK